MVARPNFCCNVRGLGLNYTADRIPLVHTISFGRAYFAPSAPPSIHEQLYHELRILARSCVVSLRKHVNDAFSVISTSSSFPVTSIAQSILGGLYIFIRRDIPRCFRLWHTINILRFELRVGVRHREASPLLSKALPIFNSGIIGESRSG